MTLFDIATEKGVAISSLRRKIARAQLEQPKDITSPLSSNIIDLLTTDKRKSNGKTVVKTLKELAAKQTGGKKAPLAGGYTQPEKKTPQIAPKWADLDEVTKNDIQKQLGEARKQIEQYSEAAKAMFSKPIKKAFEQPPPPPLPTPKRFGKLMTILPILPLPSLGLAASWGVYHFSLHFVPMPVAVIEAAGFELVYIGLAISTGLSSDLKERVTRVSLAAVAVSVLYNAISAALFAKTGGVMADSHKIVEGLHPVLFWALAILHGSPLAILAYFVSNLVIHQKRKS